MTPQLGVHGPYEDLAIAAIQLIGKIIDGQPPEVRKQLWEWYIDDMKGWRDFGAKLFKS